MHSLNKDYEPDMNKGEGLPFPVGWYIMLSEEISGAARKTQEEEE